MEWVSALEIVGLIEMVLDYWPQTVTGCSSCCWSLYGRVASPSECFENLMISLQDHQDSSQVNNVDTRITTDSITTHSNCSDTQTTWGTSVWHIYGFITVVHHGDHLLVIDSMLWLRSVTRSEVQKAISHHWQNKQSSAGPVIDMLCSALYHRPTIFPKVISCDDS